MLLLQREGLFWGNVHFSGVTIVIFSWIREKRKTPLGFMGEIDTMVTLGKWHSPMKTSENVTKFRIRGFRRLMRDPETGKVQRVQDGLGLLDAKRRYRLRARYEGRCPDCGQLVEPERRTIRCRRCTDARSERTRRARIMRLWLDGASEKHIARLCIGKIHTRRERQRVHPLAFRCVRCDALQVIHWHGQDGCRCCGQPVWPEGMAMSVRRRWLCATDEQRAERAVG